MWIHVYFFLSINFLILIHSVGFALCLFDYDSYFARVFSYIVVNTKTTMKWKRNKFCGHVRWLVSFCVYIILLVLPLGRPCGMAHDCCVYCVSECVRVCDTYKCVCVCEYQLNRQREAKQQNSNWRCEQNGESKPVDDVDHGWRCRRKAYAHVHILVKSVFLYYKIYTSKWYALWWGFCKMPV